MKIGIIGAMKEELMLLDEKIKNCQNFSSCILGECQLSTGTLNGTKVALLKSGVGKVSAALGATLLIERCKPNVVINIGSAGSLVTRLKVGDIIIADEICYHDVDVTVFGYEYGQIPGHPARFKSDKTLTNLVEKCVVESHLNSARGLIVSGDTFINNAVWLKKILYHFPKAIAVEMEATAIAHICYNFNIPFIIIRVISDSANQESCVTFKKSLIISAEKSFLVIETLTRKLSSISYI